MTRPLCRICLDDDDPRMIAPCACSGTIRWVHRRCLDNGRCMSEEAFHECATCKTKYVLDVRPNTDEARIQRELKWILARDVTLILAIFFLTSYIGGSLYDPTRSIPVRIAIGACIIFFLVGIVVIVVTSFVVVTQVLGPNLHPNYGGFGGGGGGGGGGLRNGTAAVTTSSPTPRPTRSPTPPPLEPGYSIGMVFAYTLVGMLLLLGFVTLTIALFWYVDEVWKLHKSRRERSLRVVDYVVRDLSPSPAEVAV